MPDSPTIDQIAAQTERDLIVELAQRLAPMDDYDTQAENDEAAVFVLLVRAARLYAADLQPGKKPNWIDVDTALLAVRENLEMDYEVTTTRAAGLAQMFSHVERPPGWSKVYPSL